MVGAGKGTATEQTLDDQGVETVHLGFALLLIEFTSAVLLIEFSRVQQGPVDKVLLTSVMLYVALHSVLSLCCLQLAASHGRDACMWSR